MQLVFSTWRGFVAHDPEAGAAFASWRDVPGFALDVLDGASDAAIGAAMSCRDYGDKALEQSRTRIDELTRPGALH